MNQGLGVIHETKLKFSHFRLQFFVLIDLRFHKIFHRRKHVVSAVIIKDRFSEYKIFRDITELRVGKLPHQCFPFLMIHNNIGGHQKAVHKKCGDLIRKLRIKFMVNEAGTHHGVPHHVLHDHGAHDAVIEVYLRHQSRAQDSLQF